MAGAAILPAFPLTSSSMSCKEMPSIRSLTPLWMRSHSACIAQPSECSHGSVMQLVAASGPSTARRIAPTEMFFGSSAQRISALCSADGKHQPRLAQRRDELLEVGFGDALPLCDAFDRLRRLTVHQRQIVHRAHAVASFCWTVSSSRLLYIAD